MYGLQEFKVYREHRGDLIRKVERERLPAKLRAARRSAAKSASRREQEQLPVALPLGALQEPTEMTGNSIVEGRG